MKKITLVIERTDGEYMGRVNFGDNLIIDYAKDLASLEKKFKRLLYEFHQVDEASITFQYKFDLSAVFDVFNFLKISNVAELAGVNPSLLRQYVTGNKHPSAAQAEKIENTLHLIAKELANIEIYAGKGK